MSQHHFNSFPYLFPIAKIRCFHFNVRLWIKYSLELCRKEKIHGKVPDCSLATGELIFFSQRNLLQGILTWIHQDEANMKMCRNVVKRVPNSNAAYNTHFSPEDGGRRSSKPLVSTYKIVWRTTQEAMLCTAVCMCQIESKLPACRPCVWLAFWPCLWLRVIAKLDG